MPLPAGRRDTLIGFERATVTTDDHGGEVQTWRPLGQAYAAVIWGRGDERREAARLGGSQSATFIALTSTVTAQVTIGDRIAANGNWDIKGIAPIGRSEIQFDAVASTGSA